MCSHLAGLVQIDWEHIFRWEDFCLCVTDGCLHISQFSACKYTMYTTSTFSPEYSIVF